VRGTLVVVGVGIPKHMSLLFLTGLADESLTRAGWIPQRVRLLWLPSVLPVFLLDTAYFST
jgi:hypothetical protein